MSDEATPARLEFESAERAAVNAAAFLIGARSVWDAALVDATTHDAAAQPTSRIAQAYRRALDNAAAADLRRNRAADALAAENAADRARRTAQLEQRLYPTSTVTDDPNRTVMTCGTCSSSLIVDGPGRLEHDAATGAHTFTPAAAHTSPAAAHTEHRNGYVDERAVARAEALQQLHDAALPADAPGAWIRAAIEAAQLHDDTLNASAAALADELECAAECTDADRAGETEA